MNARRPPSQGHVERATGWRIADDLRDGAAPEFSYCETFSLSVPFDRVAVALCASVDDSWMLYGSDPALTLLISHEQTVLQGPHTDVMASGRQTNLERIDTNQGRWPLLAAVGILGSGSVPCPAGGSRGLRRTGPDAPPPFGTLALARDSGPSFTEDEALEVREFGTLMGGLLLARWHAVRDVDRLDGLVRDQRHLAAGILASFLGINAQQALAVMRARAFHDNRTLSEFASDIVNVLGKA